MEIISKPEIKSVIAGYPKEIRDKISELHQLIIDVAESLGKNRLVQTLKWGEPSYLVKDGSTVRMAWKKSEPEYIGMYFICSTSLVSTFRIIYGDALDFRDNRAIMIHKDEELPVKKLKHCISLAMDYHKLHPDYPS